MTRLAAAVVLALFLIVATGHGVIVLVPAALVLGSGWLLRWLVIPRHHLPRNRVRHLRWRLHLRVSPGRGHASLLELWLRWGRFASYRESRRTRPDLTRRQRLLHPETHSAYIGRAHFGHQIRVDVQTAGVLIGEPRTGKTGVLSAVAQAAPGALVVTSSKPDIFSLTSGMRAKHGPIYVFNPMGIGGIRSNVRWNPLIGCVDPATAIRRADAFAAACTTTGTEDAQFWSSKAGQALRSCFAAAAHAERDMRAVSTWADGNGLHEAIAILGAVDMDDWAGKLRELLSSAERTADTIKMVMSQALSFLADPQLALSVLPGPGQQFDIDDFLLGGGTLYMLARANGEECVLGPLFAALASEIHERALMLGSQMPEGRLTPPLRMVLDECTRIAPVPLPTWLADAGGQGVQIFSSVHGISQLEARWGKSGAQTILDTSSLKIVLAGVSDPRLLEHLSKLVGKVSYRRHRQDQSWEFSPVMSEEMIRQLPPGWALVVRGSCSVVLVRLARGWKTPEYQRLARAGQSIASIALPAPFGAVEGQPGMRIIHAVTEAVEPPATPWDAGAA